MQIIIDANNLAGRLGILKEEDFDKKLIGLIKNFNKDKKRIITLVFDGGDRLGDKYTDGNIEVIKTPRDGFYRDADDKIIEIIYSLRKRYFGNIENKLKGAEELKIPKDDLKVVTDDIALTEKLREIIREKNLFIEIEKASDFVDRLKMKNQDSEENSLESDYDEINEELMDLWKGK